MNSTFLDAIVIKYNPITREIDLDVKESFSTFETFGLLEAAKFMVGNHWLSDSEE